LLDAAVAVEPGEKAGLLIYRLEITSDDPEEEHKLLELIKEYIRLRGVWPKPNVITILTG